MQKHENKEGFRFWKQKNAPYLLAVALAFVMVMLVAPEINEGDSMEPAIEDGQVLIVQKFSYSSKRGIPERNKVILLQKTISKKISDDNIIARVAGLPGDKVSYKEDGLYINDKRVCPYYEGMDKNGTIELNKNEVFLMCDNRKRLEDSRNKNLGPVNMKEIKGNVIASIWPISKFGGIE